MSRTTGLDAGYDMFHGGSWVIEPEHMRCSAMSGGGEAMATEVVTGSSEERAKLEHKLVARTVLLAQAVLEVSQYGLSSLSLLARVKSSFPSQICTPQISRGPLPPT